MKKLLRMAGIPHSPQLGTFRRSTPLSYVVCVVVRAVYAVVCVVVVVDRRSPITVSIKEERRESSGQIYIYFSFLYGDGDAYIYVYIHTARRPSPPATTNGIMRAG